MRKGTAQQQGRPQVAGNLFLDVHIPSAMQSACDSTQTDVKAHHAADVVQDFLIRHVVSLPGLIALKQERGVAAATCCHVAVQRVVADIGLATFQPFSKDGPHPDVEVPCGVLGIPLHGHSASLSLYRAGWPPGGKPLVMSHAWRHRATRRAGRSGQNTPLGIIGFLLYIMRSSLPATTATLMQLERPTAMPELERAQGSRAGKRHGNLQARTNSAMLHVPRNVRQQANARVREQNVPAKGAVCAVLLWCLVSLHVPAGNRKLRPIYLRHAHY